MAPGRAKTVPCVSTGFVGVPITGFARLGSVAIVTWYFVACGTVLQRSTSGSVGQLIESASAGSTSSGGVDQLFSNDRVRDQRPAWSLAAIARTRQKYVPSASEVCSAAAVLRVRNDPLLTIEPKRGSAATWSSYCAAWRTPPQLSAGTDSTCAPPAGDCGAGALSFADAAGAPMRATAAVAASDMPMRLNMDSPDLIRGRAASPRTRLWR